MSPSSTFKVQLEGRGPLTLRPTDYVATGGEGSIYRAKGTIVKIFTDPAKMSRDGMGDKLRLLKGLAHPYVVAPEGLALDPSGSPVGYYMPYAEGEPLARAFTNAFWQRESFDFSKAKTLVTRMRDTVLHAHQHRAVMVDANELNWIVALGAKGPEPRAIDVDSWAIGRFGAQVVMPSIRDWHAKRFDEKSDWFAWGIVTFQVFAGIHPYRGVLGGYKPNDLEARMKANASVFSKGIGLNRAVRDFTSIPGPLHNWYVAAFEQGERSAPPSPFDQGSSARAARTLRVVTTATGSLVFEKLLDYTNDSAVQIFPCGAVRLHSGAVIDLSSKQRIGTLSSPKGEIIRVADGWLLADWEQGSAAYSFVEARTRAASPLACGLTGRAFFRYESRLFLVTDESLVELSVLQVGRPLLSLGQQTPILRPNATKWFDGLGVQEAMGAAFMVLPFGEKACVTVRVRELDGQTVVAAKAGNRFAVATAIDRTGSYRRYEFAFAAEYGSYAASVKDADSPELNLAILPKGVCASIENDGTLDLLVPSSGKLNHVLDRQITADMALASWDDAVLYLQQGAVWRVRMT